MSAPDTILQLVENFEFHRRAYLSQDYNEAQVRRSLVGKDEKIELLYSYLSGPEFKQRVEMVVTTFMTMKNDLDREKLAMTRSWSQREKCIEKVTNSVAGMYGDLQGIVGAVLASIPSLELPEEVE